MGLSGSHPSELGSAAGYRITRNLYGNSQFPATGWSHTCTRASAAYPDAASRHHKYWPSVGRIDNVYGDKNRICTCDSVEAYADA